MFAGDAEHLFPGAMTIASGSLHLRGLGDNGGWGDPRDHKLCLAFVGPQ